MSDVMLSRRGFLAAAAGAAALAAAGCAAETTEEPADGSAPVQEEDTTMTGDRIITVTCGDANVTYQLNDSPAADALLSQLPLTVEVENFSDNEKIFYPPEELDVTDSPLAETGAAGTLAYYAPWGDVVMFYGAFARNGSLYELGQAVDDADAIAGFSGTVTVEA